MNTHLIIYKGENMLRGKYFSLRNIIYFYLLMSLKKFYNLLLLRNKYYLFIMP